MDSVDFIGENGEILEKMDSTYKFDAALTIDEAIFDAKYRADLQEDSAGFELLFADLFELSGQLGFVQKNLEHKFDALKDEKVQFAGNEKHQLSVMASQVEKINALLTANGYTPLGGSEIAYRRYERQVSASASGGTCEYVYDPEEARSYGRVTT